MVVDTRPRWLLSTCGYEYAKLTHDETYTCQGCGYTGKAVDGVTAHLEITHHAPGESLTGRLHESIGAVCNTTCADLVPWQGETRAQWYR